MRLTASTSLIALCSLPALHAQLEPAKTHQDYASALLDLMAETELCLAQCLDKQSTEAATPRLKKLSAQMNELSLILQDLPEPTIADYIAAEQQVGEFNTLWDAIKKHIQRLDDEGLYSEELLSVIKLVN